MRKKERKVALGAEAEDAYSSEKMAVFEADYSQNSLGAATPRLSHALKNMLHMAKAQDEYERHEHHTAHHLV